MGRWEYLVRVFALDKEDEVVVDYVTREYPERNWKEMVIYDPLTLEAWLNQCGREGWELVSLEPAEKQGKNGEIGRVYADATPNWARFYLCVFKRDTGKME
ncbi:MAG: hypothetical protein KIS95_13710 [Anaerolineae bacterium]|uniref:hypothetical protein n=1 Tax=Promineifilum sp. TaxID=2664178 RepID=UPI001D9CBA80|nr:hypothetical protein [Anaerolineales bacterium]MCB8936312.1 hypothetical protein [Promineifilum sp.]MCO5180163.1 hypothetical protein [Promineifilum sp.]MCW5848287.1 hypothetical protein [Anaerolineae bacterium]